MVEDSKEAFEKQKNLKVGQSIVDKKGSIWRWDGFISEENQQNKKLIDAQLKIKELVNQQNKFRISLDSLRLKKESQLEVQGELNKTLKKENIICYSLTEYRSPKTERSLKYNDPKLKIKWPTKKPNISIKDKNANSLDLIIK